MESGSGAAPLLKSQRGLCPSDWDEGGTVAGPLAVVACGVQTTCSLNT
ncbi:hypothetical protein CHELA40_13614 [Chelatococcus asaccharovorans]|nr:hypothetical protein CHELA40_13614 [Chelatococcus asaccharovorans]